MRPVVALILQIPEDSVDEVPKVNPMIILLLVDDDEMSRDIIGSRLTRLGYVVVKAVNGREGIEAARNESPNLILMDLCMPGMDGFEAAKQLKTDGATAHIPIIALSALNTALDVRRAIQAGCDSFQTKPVNLTSLHNKIRRLIWSAAEL
jgi:two-component system cell cycle response regulator DivK